MNINQYFFSLGQTRKNASRVSFLLFCNHRSERVFLHIYFQSIPSFVNFSIDMGYCNDRRVFFVIVVLFEILICQYSEMIGDKILKFCRNCKTVFLHGFLLLWSWIAFIKTLFWSVMTHHSFWAGITLTLIWRGEKIFWPIEWMVLKCPHSPYEIHMNAICDLIFVLIQKWAW